MKKIISQWGLRVVLGLVVLPALRFALMPADSNPLLKAAQQSGATASLGKILNIEMSESETLTEQPSSEDLASASNQTALRNIQGARIDEVEGHEILITPAGGSAKSVKFDLKSSSKANCAPTGG